MTYQYKGANYDVIDEPLEAPAADPSKFNPKKCGTMSGYRQHLKFREEACRPCKDAKCEKSAREYANRRAARGVKVVTFNPEACGTNKGHRRHQFHGVPACAPCLRAHADYIKDYRARKAAA